MRPSHLALNFSQRAAVPSHSAFRIPHSASLLSSVCVSRQRLPYFDLGPQVGGHFLLQVRHLVKPTANPSRLGPPRLKRFAHPAGPLGGNRHRDRHAPLGQSPSHLPTPLGTLTLRRRETEPHLASLLTPRPHTAPPSLLAPAPSRVVDRIAKEVSHGRGAQIPHPPRCGRLR